MSKILVPEDVFAGLFLLIKEADVDMRDHARVVKHATLAGDVTTAEWIRTHKEAYMEGIVSGFASEGPDMIQTTEGHRE